MPGLPARRAALACVLAIASSLAMGACGSSASMGGAGPDAMSPSDGDAGLADGGGALGEERTDGSPSDAADALALADTAPEGSAVDSSPTEASSEAAADSGWAGCRSNSDCAPVSYYRGAQDGPCVGTCARATSCTTDSQCDAGICRQTSPAPACSTGGGSFFCLAPCRADSDCPPQDECLSDGHCDPRPCSKCPAYLSCVGGSVTGVCQAKNCQTDGDCTQGYCVKGSCQGSLGICEAMCG